MGLRSWLEAAGGMAWTTKVLSKGTAGGRGGGAREASYCLGNKNNLYSPVRVLVDSQPQTSPEFHTLYLFFCLFSLLVCSFSPLWPVEISLTDQDPARSHLLLNPHLSCLRRNSHFLPSSPGMLVVRLAKHTSSYISISVVPLTTEAFLQGRTTRQLGILSACIMPGPRWALVDHVF